MKQYLTYTAADFAGNASFFKWVKYPGKDPALDAFWQNWIKQNPHKREEVDEARQMIRAVLEEKQYTPAEDTQREVWQRIQNAMHQHPPISKKIPFWSNWTSRAAVALIAVGIGWYIWKIKHEPTQMPSIVMRKGEVFEKQVNHGAMARTIVLADGSSIVLQPHSTLEYPQAFANDLREVYLTGEAFFEVKKDPTRPFLVHANEIITRVLGTSFTVRNDFGQGVRVQVKTGKVSVFKEKDKVEKNGTSVEGVVLMPNQQVEYARHTKKMTKSLVENPSVLIPAAKLDFEFEDAPIKDVLGAIEEAYGVDIVYDEELLSGCFLNASLSDVPLYDKLKLICKGIGATYEIIDSHIIIYGTGCTEK